MKVDRTGKTYGRLTVLREVPGIRDRGRNIYWVCRCSCGTETTVSSASLSTGGTKSCGCLRRKLPGGRAAANMTYSLYAIGAKRRGHSWGLSMEEFLSLTSQNCHYCGVPPRQTRKIRWAPNSGAFTYNGIDRVDNAKGYEAGNVVPCCGVCNRSKSDMPREEFVEWLRRVSEHAVWNREKIFVDATGRL